MKKEKIFFALAILLIASIILISAQDSTNTAGSSSGTQTGVNLDAWSDGTQLTTGNANSNSVSVPQNAKEPAKVGDKVLTQPDGNGGEKPAAPEDVKFNGGTVTPNEFVEGKPNGGTFTAGGEGEVNGKKVDLGDRGSAKIKDNEITNAQEGTSVSFNEHGKIEEADIIGAKPEDGKGTEVTIDGNKKKVTIGIPEAGTLSKETGTNYVLDMPKEGGKLQMPKVEKKTEENKEGEDLRFEIRSSSAFSQFPDELAKKAGYASGLSFKTDKGASLIFDSKDEMWRTKGNVEFALPGQKENFMTIKNLGEIYNNAAKESLLFFGQESRNTPQAKKLISEGAVGAIINGKDVSSFSTYKDKTGPYVEFADGNSVNGYASAMISGPNSGIMVGPLSKGGSNVPGVTFQGDGIFVGGDNNIYKKQGNDLRFFDNVKISDIFGNNVPSFSPSKNYQATILPLDKNGNYLTGENGIIYVNSRIDASGKIINQVPTSRQGIPAQTPTEPARVQGNLPGIDSLGGQPVPVPTTPSVPPQYIQPTGNAQQNAMASTVRIIARDATGAEFGTGTIIGAKGNDAYVLTAGHIFRTNGGKGPVNVDIFDVNAQKVRTVQGQVINYQDSNKKADLALVRIPAFEGISATKVAPEGYTPSVGEPVFDIGCSHGADPTCRTGSQIKAVDFYKYYSNLIASGAPAGGRSGGGLFRSNDGKLVGVLSGIESGEEMSQSGTGLYGGITDIQKYLSRLGLSNLYRLILLLIS